MLYLCDVVQTLHLHLPAHEKSAGPCDSDAQAAENQLPEVLAMKSLKPCGLHTVQAQALMAMLERFLATRADFSASSAGADFCGDSNIKWFVSKTGQSIRSYKQGNRC